MWIRTQDKLRLVECNDFIIKKGKLNDDEYVETDGYWKINDFAEYDSLDKCKVVLEEIQKLISKRDTYNVYGNITRIFKTYDQIYQFPLNNEV